MDLKGHAYILVAALIATALRFAFNLDGLAYAIVFGICLGACFFISAKLGYTKIAPKKTG